MTTDVPAAVATDASGKHSDDVQIREPWRANPDTACSKGHRFRWSKAPVPAGLDGSSERACPACGEKVRGGYTPPVLPKSSTDAT